jgi:hypothetical protein
MRLRMRELGEREHLLSGVVVDVTKQGEVFPRHCNFRSRRVFLHVEELYLGREDESVEHTCHRSLG